jgi:hypothetical protein
MPGTSTSEAEVTNISRHGFWILVDERELFVPFEEFAWFRDATVGAIINVERPHPHYLRWPDLDVDLTLESIEHPERYPLKAKQPE